MNERYGHGDRTPKSGVYAVHISVPENCRVGIGRLGTFDLEAGDYTYVGRARSRLGARLARHFGSRQRLHWHVDYLLRVGRAVDVRIFPFTEEGECRLAREYSLRCDGLAIPRFGSSDCGCPGHLIRGWVSNLSD